MLCTAKIYVESCSCNIAARARIDQVLIIEVTE